MGRSVLSLSHGLLVGTGPDGVSLLQDAQP